MLPHCPVSRPALLQSAASTRPAYAKASVFSPPPAKALPLPSFPLLAAHAAR